MVVDTRAGVHGHQRGGLALARVLQRLTGGEGRPARSKVGAMHTGQGDTGVEAAALSVSSMDVAEKVFITSSFGGNPRRGDVGTFDGVQPT